MFDNFINMKNKLIDRVKNVSLIRALQIGSGAAVIIGTILINLVADNDIIASDVLDKYENDANSSIDDDDEPIIEVD